MQRFLRAAVLLCALPAACQQPVVVDWETKSLREHPSVVDHDTQVVIRVENVNDVMFTYSISLQGTPRQNYDFSAIEKAFALAGKGAGEAPACKTAKGKKMDDFKK